MLRAKGKNAQADMVRNIIPAGGMLLFARLNNWVWDMRFV